MDEFEEKILEDIIVIIKDYLQLLIQNNDSCLYYLKNYCKGLTIPISCMTSETLNKLLTIMISFLF